MQQIYDRQLARRSAVWSAIAMALFALLGMRLFWIQVINHQYFSDLADQTQFRKWPIPAPRGNIYDRNGTPLALSLKLFSVAADPTEINDPKAVAAKLVPLLRMPEEELVPKLTSNGKDRHVVLRDTVDEPVAKAVRDLKINGLIVTTEWKRAYPHGAIAAALTGFVGKEGSGLAGIEAGQNQRLAGADGEMLVVLDGRLPRSRSQIPGRSVVTRAMAPGESVGLTIDIAIQAIAEEELAKAVEAAQAKGGTAIVMDPLTGDVLALATQPSFDPNDLQRYADSSFVSHAVASPYEPGSTFKVITACAAIEEGVMSHGETYNCTGSRPVGNRTISCAAHGGSSAHGVLDLDHMVIKSCNVGMATVAMAVGPDRMYKWIRKFGFGERTGIELAGESPGQLSRPDSWPQIQLANIGFGQGISVTPVQLLSAYCAVANGGKRVHPRLIKSSAKTPTAGERILSPTTAERMRVMLEKVVTEGTGKQARVPGRRVAGKTGTAQKPTPGVGFRSGLYIGSFIGFAPVSDPRVAIIVVIDEPKGSYYGAVVAAPAFSAICERTLAYLRVPPDAPAEPKVVAYARQQE
jgi:cell division protein FtsI/penicillin-binding protein 2